MERRGGGRGGGSWRSRESEGGRRRASSSSNVDRWRSPFPPASNPNSRNFEDRGQRTPQEKITVADENANFSSIVGSCPEMCPAKEREQREMFRDLSVFERLNGNPRKTSSQLAVKKFCRTISAASEQPSNIRPLPVLQETLRYLLEIFESSDQPFEVIHDFILDRTRSIRQDLSMQNIINDDVILMYEEMVKFHIISEKRLRKECRNVDLLSLLHMNMDQLTKTLTSLYDLYADSQKNGGKNYNASEFYSFYLILQLGHSSQERNSVSLWLRKISVSILKSKEMLFSRSVLRQFRMGNYCRFLKMAVTESSHLQFCLLEPLLDEVRARALFCINNSGYKLHPYPLSHLSQILSMKEEDLASLCHDCGLETRNDEAGILVLPTKQAACHLPRNIKAVGFLGSDR